MSLESVHLSRNLCQRISLSANSVRGRWCPAMAVYSPVRKEVARLLMAAAIASYRVSPFICQDLLTGINQAATLLMASFLFCPNDTDPFAFRTHLPASSTWHVKSSGSCPKRNLFSISLLGSAAPYTDMSFPTQPSSSSWIHALRRSTRSNNTQLVLSRVFILSPSKSMQRSLQT